MALSRVEKNNVGVGNIMKLNKDTITVYSTYLSEYENKANFWTVDRILTFQKAKLVKI